jgi:hypothetical protein
MAEKIMIKMSNCKIWIVLFCTMTCLSSCKKTEYKNAIPADAEAVISIDMKALAEKSGIGDKENASLKQHLTDALKNGLNAETAERLDKIMDDPSKSGFDFSEPVFVFMTKQLNYQPIVDLCVDSRRSLTSTLEALAKSNLATRPVKTEHFRYSVINGSVVIAYNNGTALCMQSQQGATNELLLALDKIMVQTKEKSFCKTETFKQLSDRKDDICFINKMGSLGLGGGLTFQNGSASLQIEELEGKDDKVKSNNELLPVNNSLLQCFPKSMPFIFTIGMNGEGAFKQLADITGFDVSEIPALHDLMESVCGDLTIGFNAWDKKNYTFLAYAQIKDADKIRNIYKLSDEFGKFKKVGLDEYQYVIPKGNIWFGIDKNLLYMTNDGKWAEDKWNLSGGDKGTFMQNPVAVQAKGKKMFFKVEPEALLPLLTQGKKIPTLISALTLNSVDYIEGYDVSPTSWKVELLMKDKNTNTLKQIVKMIRQIVGM